MNDDIIAEDDGHSGIKKLPLAAAVVALIGLVDAVYLTVKHFRNEVVPCSLLEGCEKVLTSAYAEIGGVPIAAFGAFAYFLAFSLAVLAAYGNRLTWTLFRIQVTLMAAYTLWLLYLQAFVIGAFCQFCLISAATTLILFIFALFARGK
ncbi:MAG: vitamin K epoxide reductase family protein [Acidobacteria bacterium]|nr:vitamin K epoxide reductase family protein [Acidobacteriota bacterium]